MSLIKWSNLFSTGIDEIDKQHTCLIDLINEIYDGIKNCDGEHAIQHVLPKMLEYTRFHFTFEEKFMMEHEYPEFPDHYEHHYRLTEEVEKMTDNMQHGKHINQLEIATFMADWLKNHILDEDMGYAKYIAFKDAHLV